MHVMAMAMAMARTVARAGRLGREVTKDKLLRKRTVSFKANEANRGSKGDDGSESMEGQELPEGHPKALRDPNALPSWYYEAGRKEAFPTSPQETFMASARRLDGKGSLHAASSGLLRFCGPVAVGGILWWSKGEGVPLPVALVWGVAFAGACLGVVGEANKLLSVIGSVGRRGGGGQF